MKRKTIWAYIYSLLIQCPKFLHRNDASPRCNKSQLLGKDKVILRRSLEIQAETLMNDIKREVKQNSDTAKTVIDFVKKIVDEK